jgi:hypothetical protein
VEESLKAPGKLIYAAILVILTAGFSAASDIYVAQNAAGGNTGTDCADAHAASWFNSSSNWGSSFGQIGAGTTVHLCGTFNAPAGSSGYLTFHGSGNSSNPITLLFESDAVLTAPYWSGPAISIGANNYVTVNGGTNGVIQATANGTNLANQQDNGVGVDCGSVNMCSNILVENLTIADLYVHACPASSSYTSCTDAGGGNTLGIRLWGGNNDTIYNNTVHDVHWSIVMLYGTNGTNSTGMVAYNNTVYNNDHGVVFADEGSGSTAAGSNCSNAIYNNDISDFQSWDNATDAFHHDGIHAFANNAPSAHYSVCVYSNHLHGDGGVTFNSFIFMESNSQNSLVFNNVLNLTANGNPTTCTGTGILGPATGSGTNGVSLGVYNNTIVGYSTSNCIAIGLQEQTKPTAYNNIATTANEMTYTNSTTGQIWDYNTYYNTGSGNWQFGSFASWQSSGYDAHGQNANPNLTSSFTLNSGSPAIGAAKNLTSLGITALNTGAPQTFGVGGSCGSGCSQRSASGAWDAGAYAYGSSSAPTPPTGLAAVVQ